MIAPVAAHDDVHDAAHDGVHVELIAHACIRVETAQSVLLCDPWFFGTVFNDGWRLNPAPDLEALDFSSVTHLWISHEHPDHFHLPSLRALATMLDPARVTVLFQTTNSHKVFDALADIGFTDTLELDHLVPVALDDDLVVFSYAHRQLDSALGVIVGGRNALLNLNDVELNANDCRIIRQRFGAFPVLFNQFSIAAFYGDLDDETLRRERLAVLEMMADHHRLLGAELTVPFASFFSFCQVDNVELNAHVNSVDDARSFLEAAGLGCAVLTPMSGPIPLGELAAHGDVADSDRCGRDSSMPEPLVSTDLGAVMAAFAERTTLWKSRTIRPIYRRLHDIPVHVADLDRCAVLDFQRCIMRPDAGLTPADCDLVINSQPLQHAFGTPFGIQTLGVSGRYRLMRDVPQWKLVRIISSLSNAGLYLGVRSVFSPTTLRWAWQRRRGLPSQVRQQVARFRHTDQAHRTVPRTPGHR